MNIVSVEIADDPIIEGRSGISSKNNQPYKIPSKQKAYMHGVARYPMEFEVPVPEKAGPYRPGMYLLGGQCFTSDQYGPKFNDRDVVLVPLQDAVKQLAGAKAKEAA